MAKTASAGSVTGGGGAIAAASSTDDGLTPVRTTFNPHEVIRVGAAELLDLERQGLVYDESADGEGDVAGSGVVPDPIIEPGDMPGDTEGSES